MQKRGHSTSELLNDEVHRWRHTVHQTVVDLEAHKRSASLMAFCLEFEEESVLYVSQ